TRRVRRRGLRARSAQARRRRADLAWVDELAPQLVSAPVPPRIDEGVRAARRGNELLTQGVRLYLLVGVAALAAFYALPDDTRFQDTIYYPAIGLASVVAIVAGVAWYRPEQPWPWMLFAAGQLLFVAGDVVFGYYEHILGEEPFPSPADALYLVAYPV